MYGSHEPLLSHSQPRLLKRSKKICLYNAFLVFLIILGVTLLVIVILLLTGHIDTINSDTNKRASWLGPLSNSSEGHYLYSGVASDHPLCSAIGNYILNVEGGSAVDAGIATCLCVGIHSYHSAGIGGGSFMVFYNRSSGTSYTLDFREVAPFNATANMFAGNASSTTGGLAIAVPGEIRGLYEAWKRFGRLPWKNLFIPNINVLRSSHYISRPLVNAMQDKRKEIFDDPGLKELFVNKETGELYQEGDLLVDNKLADTFQLISDDPESFYNGSLAAQIVEEIQGAGGIITARDLANYTAEFRKPVVVQLHTDTQDPSMSVNIHTMLPPSSGTLVSFIMNILEGYNFTSQVDKSLADSILYYHRMVEAFKFAYAKRSALGDSSFDNNDELVRNLTSKAYAEYIRSLITDDKTHEVNYYGPSFDWPTDKGTTHLSVVARDGDAVSITSTINTYFGCKVRGINTGIIYNNEMDDFSTPNKTNSYGLPPSPSNFIEPGKRPMSSMSPVIYTDNNGNVRMVVGAAGGSAITTGVSQVSSLTLHLNRTMKESIDMPRIHHQLIPDCVSVESIFPKDISKGLEDKGHKLCDDSDSVVQGIARVGYVYYANCDFRKGGAPSGY